MPSELTTWPKLMCWIFVGQTLLRTWPSSLFYHSTPLSPTQANQFIRSYILSEYFLSICVFPFPWLLLIWTVPRTMPENQKTKTPPAVYQWVKGTQNVSAGSTDNNNKADSPQIILAELRKSWRNMAKLSGSQAKWVKTKPKWLKIKSNWVKI